MPAGCAVKLAAEQRFAATPAADDDLTFTLEANATYLVRGRIFLSAPASVDAKFALSVGGASINFASFYAHTEQPPGSDSGTNISHTADENGIIGSANLAAETARATGTTGSTSDYLDYYTPVYFCGLIEVGSTGGDFAVMWSQNTADGTYPAVLRAGGTVQWERIDHEGTKTLWVFKETNELRRRSDYPTLTDDAELALTLEAGKAYWITALTVCTFPDNFATTIRYALTGDPELADLRVEAARVWVAPTSAWNANAAFVERRSGPTASVDSPSVVDANLSTTSNYRGGVFFNGRVDAGESETTLKIQWRPSDNGAGGNYETTTFAGSFLLARELNPCVI